MGTAEAVVTERLSGLAAQNYLLACAALLAAAQR